MIYYNIDNQEKVAVQMFSFNVFRIGNYFAGELIKTEAEVKVGRLKNGRGAGKVEAMEEMIKGGDMVLDWICRLCSMIFESGVKFEDWRSFDCFTVQF